MSARHLMITCQGIGNTILAFPILKAFRDAGMPCDLAASDNGSAQLAALTGLAGEIHIWQEKEGGIFNYKKLAGILRSKKYEAAYALAPAARRENVLLRLSGARVKKGWRTAHPWRLFSFRDPAMPFWDEKKHDLFSNQVLTGLEGQKLKSAVFSMREIFLKIGSSQKQKSSGLVIGVQPFTKARFKCWSFLEIENFLSGLRKQRECEFLIFGAASEEEELSRLAGRVGGSSVIAGRPWEEVIRCLNGSDGFIGVDSSVAHLAAVCGVPACILYGATAPERVSALGKDVVILQDKTPGEGYRFSQDYPKTGNLGLRVEKALGIASNFAANLKTGSLENFFDAYSGENLAFGGKLIKI